MTNAVLVEADGVTRWFGEVPGIQDADLKVRAGEIVALVGPNGAGKTTLMNIVAGILSPSRGRVRVLDYTWGTAPESRRPAPLPPDLWRLRRHLGFVPASHEVPEFLTAREFLRFIAALYENPRSEAESAIERWLAYLDLSGAADRLMKGYSHGMRKKVQLAAALLPRPRVFICDEPTSGLDPATVVLVRDLFHALAQQGVAVLLATHDLPFAEKVADRFYFVHSSRIAAQGSAEELKARYHASDLAEAFLFAVGGGERRELLRELVAHQPNETP
ncbi:ABC transporter ATP-binding protein [Brockia lithotrophica]|uniref:ABC-2 type transport system ATP-binding protein n=1 Tax=Brockia lithotrophica TaxID=933949 RepID=A0A660L7H0_9BACL|nr:ABC transporter ATP-binding protein [Brockia lithotrophica]RKQ88782.1 ABC-2 type transport system ATP-binding protein [Brockia lithotrophica]